jgi:hypothetical protein
MEETAISCVRNDVIMQIIEEIQEDGDVAYVTASLFVPYFIFDRADAIQSGCASGRTPIKGDADYVRDARDLRI